MGTEVDVGFVVEGMDGFEGETGVEMGIFGGAEAGIGGGAEIGIDGFEDELLEIGIVGGGGGGACEGADV